SEKASPLMLLAYKPAFFASFSKAAVLYQPEEPGFPGAAGFSKKTPIVAAFEPNALVILDASPNPVEAPITNTFLGPLMTPLLRTYSSWFTTFFSHPFGWEVIQINPRTLGSIIM